MKYLKIINRISIALFAILSLYSCTRRTTTPPDPNEEELITTIWLTLVDSAGVQPTVTTIYRDLDGDGGNAPSVWDSLKLKPNTTYLTQVLLLNESTAPADTISNEVLEEDDEHLFCFFPSGVNMSIIRTDSDGTYEVGLQSKWRTGVSSNGSVQVVLKHQPGVKNGDCAVGSTDVDVTFPSRIE
jgi:hypothetical protein